MILQQLKFSAHVSFSPSARRKCITEDKKKKKGLILNTFLLDFRSLLNLQINVFGSLSLSLLYFNHILRDESSKGLRGFDCISKKTSCSADWNSVNLHQCRLSIRRFLLSRLIYNVYGLTFSITVSTLKICLCSSLSTFSLSLDNEMLAPTSLYLLLSPQFRLLHLC